MTFPDGSREPLHGHNYRVSLRGYGEQLQRDMVFDFLHLKPIVKELCDRLDHKLLLPLENPCLSFAEDGEGKSNIKITTGDGHFSIPKTDIFFLPIANTSAELIAVYLAQKIQQRVWEAYRFRFATLQVEVEESPGQSAVFELKPPKIEDASPQ